MFYSYLLLGVCLLNPLAICFFVLWYKLKTRKPDPTEKPLTTTATELLNQLNRGGAVVITQVVDPSQIFMYSPKDRR